MIQAVQIKLIVIKHINSILKIHHALLHCVKSINNATKADHCQLIVGVSHIKWRFIKLRQ